MLEQISSHEIKYSGHAIILRVKRSTFSSYKIREFKPMHDTNEKK